MFVYDVVPRILEQPPRAICVAARVLADELAGRVADVTPPLARGELAMLGDKRLLV